MIKVLSVLVSTLLVSFAYSANQGIPYNLVAGLPDVHITPTSTKIGETWLQGNIWCKHVIEKFYSLLSSDDCFVVFDLGAQTGCFSLLAKYFPTSMWYAFEPIEEAVKELRENLALNDICNVAVYQTAVADFVGTITLNMPPMNHWGLATTGRNVFRFTTVAKRNVECIKLDNFVVEHRIEKVHFMKLDTEGAELTILRGAQNMIMRDHPIILMEYNTDNMKQCGVLKKDLDAFLKSMGYEWHLISYDDILCIPISFLKQLPVEWRYDPIHMILAPLGLRWQLNQSPC